MDPEIEKMDVGGSNSSMKAEENLASATCRICRGEDTLDNPLFHPCKCKGSIKYIHESCLMEWIASKNIDISKSGTVVHCDICHYPINFKTTYSDNMPDKIPMSLLFKRSLISCFLLIKEGVTIFLAFILFVIGIPLTWNLFGKLYTFILDKELPYQEDFFRSVVFGFNSNDKEAPFELGDILFQVALNYRFSLLQIVMVVILHISLYFQYDMIVRENVFSKMVFHKIGPQYTKEELIKIQLKERFPMMDDETIENVAKIMKGREEIRNLHDNNPVDESDGEEDDQEGDVPHQHADDANNEDVENQRAEGARPDDELEEGSEVESISEHASTDGSQPDAEAGNVEDFQEQDYDIQLERPLDAFMNRRAQNDFDDLLDEREPVIPVEIPAVEAPHPFQPPQLQEERRPAPVRIAEEINPQVEEMDAQNPPPPIIINLKLKLVNVLAYYIVAVVLIAVYLAVSYLLPTFTGFGLLRCYIGIIKIFLSGVVHLSYLLRLPILYKFLQENVPHFDDSVLMTRKYAIYPGRKIYQAYKTNSMKSSIILRSIPALVSYVTTMSVINISSELISKGFGRENGMKNRSRRFIFQILFAVKCTFKVFTLFFIELAAFPVLTGLMLDFSLFCPLLNPGKIFWAPRICESWPPSIFFVYWTIGTLYMYWFAKYIGMIRKHIIRPGVLFFIRSPDDPNIKILHDSLIHPMSIQVSRLCLSMFIYAVFIIVGFGFHTRFLFPVLMNSKMLTINTSFHVRLDFFHSGLDISFLYPIPFYFAKQLIESTSSVKLYVRKYWIRVFDVSSKKLRLSSFILGNDIPTERGHIIYRNFFYKLFARRKAQWSNKELYTSPKTSNQAKELFRENKSVHAYFVPDGILMRVPSSDIISRTYVQTLFVPVTKDDKLLKPLDLNAIKERNSRNAGDFGYLDEQNTEYDGYSIVYAPPNFRTRYISLLVFVWLFASLLVLLTTFASQYIFTFAVALLILPALIVIYVATHIFAITPSRSGMNVEVVYLEFANLIKSNLQQLNIFFVCFGAIGLSLLLERYHQYKMSKINLEEHIIPVVVDGEEIEHHQDNNPVERNNANPVGNWNAIFADIINRDEVKAAVFLVFMVIVVWMKGFAVVFNMLQLSFVRGYFSPNSFKEYKGLYAGFWDMSSLPISTVFTFVCLRVVFSLSTKFARNRNRSFAPLFRLLIAEAWKELHFTLFTTIPIVGVWIVSTGFEYTFYGINYTSLIAPLIFLFRYRLQPDFKHLEWTMPQHFCYLAITCILTAFCISQAIKFGKTWFGEAIQNVKDEVYAKGRSLENFTSGDN